MKRLKTILLTIFAAVSCLLPCACAEEEKTSFAVTIEKEGKGVCRATSEEVSFGDAVEFSIKPDQNYRVKEFSINGEVIAVTGTVHVEYCVTEDLDVKVVFEYAMVRVTYDTGDINEDIPEKFVEKGEYFGFMPNLLKKSEEPDDFNEIDENDYYCLEDNQVFVGWYTQENGQGKLINGGCYAPDTDCVLYAYVKTVGEAE